MKETWVIKIGSSLVTKSGSGLNVKNIRSWAAQIDEIMNFAKRKKIFVISDSAQAIGIKYKNKYAGTLAHIGGYSFNYHKPINCGEGGMLVTNSKKFALKMYLIRNHGEAVVKKMGFKDIKNIIGYNFRMGEIEASIALTQMKKLNSIIKYRQTLAKILNKELTKLPFLEIPKKLKKSGHLYYYYALKYTNKRIPKKKIVNELNKRKVPVEMNYTNLHLLPMFQKKIAYGKYPWHQSIYKGSVSYKKGICINAENMNEKEYIGLHMYKYNYKKMHMNNVVRNFKIVWKKFFNYTS